VDQYGRQSDGESGNCGVSRISCPPVTVRLATGVWSGSGNATAGSAREFWRTRIILRVSIIEPLAWGNDGMELPAGKI
jgi:hypothetical protein